MEPQHQTITRNTDESVGPRSLGEHGADENYREHADNYSNPHEPEVRQCIEMAVSRWSLDLSHVLDLAAGSGEATLGLRELGAVEIDACDPYLFAQYRAPHRPTVRAVQLRRRRGGALAGREYSLIVCSFALHLVDTSRLPMVCLQLGTGRAGVAGTHAAQAAGDPRAMGVGVGGGVRLGAGAGAVVSLTEGLNFDKVP